MPLVIVVAAFLMFLPTRAAFAAGCTELGGTVVGSECQISGNVGNKSGTFNLDQSLHILDGGKIVVPPSANVKPLTNALTISVCAAPAVCHFVMDRGAEITGSVTQADAIKGVGATIDISATGTILLAGDGSHGALISSNQTAGSCTGGKGGIVKLTAVTSITTEAGSVISVDGKPCPGGAITLLATEGTVTVAGLLSSESTFSGTGALQPPGGGPITVIARCDLTVDGTIRSKGADAGADLIHLEGGCHVVINGLVASTGGGHGIPNSPPNHCYGPVGNPSRPDKPQNSTACIEVWAGNSLVISPTGELNADIGLSGDNDGVSWIDLFARGDIAINGDSSAPFSVHANGVGGSGGDGEEGGIVTVKTTEGSVTASGKALQASSTTASNSDAGRITVEAAFAVTLSGSTPTLEAKAKDHGGAIAARAFTGALSWLGGLGDVKPIATGTINLTACAGLPTTTGTEFRGVLTSAKVCDPASPTLPSYVVLPECLCGLPFPPVECPEDRFRVISRTVSSVQQGPPNHATLSEAVQKASTGEIIGVFLNTNENVNIPSKGLTITQCTLAKIIALDPAKPAIDISTPDTVLVIGLDTVGGTAGWLVQTDGHELRGVRAKGATEAGIEIVGSGNRVSWNLVKKNGAGIVVSGSGNNLRGGTVEKNTGDGVQFSATAEANVLQGADIQLNGANGISIEGSGNTILDNPRVDSNGQNGMLVTGSGNLVKGNVIGSDKTKGNGGNGVMVTGAGNKLYNNKVSANLGDGFTIVGGTAGNPNALKGNQSNVGNSGQNKENKGAEYRLANTVTSLDGNKADGTSVPKAEKCPGFPKKNEAKDFPTPYVCE
jgi:parallel beta-helix repeat protein